MKPDGVEGMLETTDGELIPASRLLGQANKYHARRTWSELCGRWFASKAEAERGEELAIRQKAGEIRELVFQPRYKLSDTPPVTYVADFAYWEGHLLVVEDVKGVDTPVSRVKRAWAKDKLGVEVRIIK